MIYIYNKVWEPLIYTTRTKPQGKAFICNSYYIHLLVYFVKRSFLVCAVSVDIRLFVFLACLTSKMCNSDCYTTCLRLFILRIKCSPSSTGIELATLESTGKDTSHLHQRCPATQFSSVVEALLFPEVGRVCAKVGSVYQLRREGKLSGIFSTGCFDKDCNKHPDYILHRWRLLCQQTNNWL